MIKKDIKRLVLPLAVMICLGIMPFLATPVQAANPPAFFTLSVLAPNTNPARNQWATLMVEQLPKIGIGVDVFDHTGWAQISPRSWGYPGPYPVPSYAEGGFDILFIGWGWGLDIDMVGLFDTPSFPPDGDNHYQYSRPEMDAALASYSQSFLLADRIQYAEDIQALLYEDVPAATITYPTDIFAHDPTLVADSWTPLLWDSSYQDMSDWDIPGQTEFNYGCPADFEDFHPMKVESVYDMQWTQQIYGGLVERNPESPYDNAYGPYAATTFTSSDGLVYQIAIDPDLKFADGEVCNATDVEFSFDLLIDPDFGQPDYGFYKKYITNESVVINSEFDVTITFNASYVFQESNLGIDIMPKHIWGLLDPELHEAQAVAWAADDILDSQKIIGIGPYYLDDYDGTNGVIHLKANPYWTDWGGHTAQKFTDIYFEFWSNKEGALSALAGGDLDMIDTNFSPTIDEIPATVDYTLVDAPGSQEMGFNMLHPYIGTGELCPIAVADSGKYIRQAISHLIPRQVIVDEILEGLGAPGVTPFPNAAVGFDVSLLPYEYSIETAKLKMELAGFVYPETTTTAGFGLYVVIGILALAGASQVFFLKRRK